MIEYAARHFVRVNGAMYTPGEIIEGEIPREKLERLLHLGAVVEVGKALNPTADTPSHFSEEDIPENESEDDVEFVRAPEIDAMEGIVSKPKKARKRK